MQFSWWKSILFLLGQSLPIKILFLKGDSFLEILIDVMKLVFNTQRARTDGYIENACTFFISCLLFFESLFPLIAWPFSINLFLCLAYQMVFFLQAQTRSLIECFLLFLWESIVESNGLVAFCITPHCVVIKMDPSVPFWTRTCFGIRLPGRYRIPRGSSIF